MPSVPPPSLPLANGSDIAILEGHEYVNVTLQSPGMSQVIKLKGVCRNFLGGAKQIGFSKADKDLPRALNKT